MVSGSRCPPDVHDENPGPDVLLARALAERLAELAAPDLDVLSVRILLAPPGCGAQPWHLDYAKYFPEVRTVFLSVTRSTTENCTEILQLGGSAALTDLVARAKRQGKALSSEAWEDLRGDGRIVPVTFEPWEVGWVRTSHAFHRRGANRSGFARITFNVDLARLADAPDYIDFDYARHVETDRIAPLEEIDELDEQDVSLDVFPDPWLAGAMSYESNLLDDESAAKRLQS